MTQLEGSLSDLLDIDSISIDASATDREDAIRQAGGLLVASGAARPDYVESMLEREWAVSTFVGEGIAMPHGTLADNGAVIRQALSVLRLARPIDWDGEQVDVVIGIAAIGAGQIRLLSQLAVLLLRPDRVAALRAAPTPSRIRELFG